MADEKKKPKRLPKRLQPLPTTRDPEIFDAIAEWLRTSGTAKGKGQPTIPSTDPTDVGAEPVFARWEGDQAIFKQGPQKGKPEMPLGPLGEPAAIEGHPDGTGDLGETGPFTGEQIKMLLDDIYGTKGGIENFTLDDIWRKKGPMITSLPSSGKKGPLITSLPPSGGGGAKINVPPFALPGRGILRGGSIDDPLLQPTGPLINVPLPDRKALLAAMARVRARHNRYQYVA